MSEAQVQTETNNKLAARTGAPGGRIFTCDGRRIDAGRARVVAFDFRHPVAQRHEGVAKLEALYAKFAERLTARLSTFLRMECAVKPADFTSPAYSAFAATMKDPTHICLFQAEPLAGIGILEIGLPAALAMTSRMLGGTGRVQDGPRELTEIETALMEDVEQLILAEWIKQFPARYADIRPAIMGHDTSGRFMHAAEPATIHLVMHAEVTLGEATARMQLGVPVEMMEPVLHEFQAAQVRVVETRPRVNMAWRAQFDAINVPVVAEWVLENMSVADIVALKPGDVLQMEGNMIARTRVRLANANGFIGTAGVEDGHIAVQLTQKESTE